MLTATPHQGEGEKFRHLLGLIDEYKFFSSDSLTPDNVKSVTVKNRKRAATDFKGNLIFKARIPSIVKIARPETDIEVELYNEVSDYVAKYYNLAYREGNFAFMFLLILYQRMVSSSSRAIYQSLNYRLEYLTSLKAQISEIHEKKVDPEDIDELNAQEAYDELTQETKEYTPAEKARMVVIPSRIKEELAILDKCVTLAKKASFGRQDYKTRKTIEIISEVSRRENDPNTKFLIFTEFIATQKYLGEVLEGLGYKVAYLNGRMGLDRRIEAKRRFKDDHQILISTDAGGEGINLQFCHVIINYDLPWNPMKIEQRIGRLDRIGQLKDVFVFNYILKDTVEERVREILEEKLDLIASQFGDDKRADVLSLLQDEFNFDRVFIDAIREKEKNIPELKKIGESIYLKAKEIIEKQDYLLPFSDKIDPKKLENSMIEDESNMVRELVEGYAKFKGIELKEYAKKKGVYYIEHPLAGQKPKNIVFDKELALDDETNEFVNITHQLTKNIVNEAQQKEALTFNLEIHGTGLNLQGVLFYYRVDLTNNEGFLRRYLIPIFVDQDLNYSDKVTKLFESKNSFTLKTGISVSYNPKPEEAKEKAQEELNRKIKQLYTETKLELIKKLDQEQQRLNKYFEDKEKAISKIAIANIRDAKQKELIEQRIQEKTKLEKKKNLAPNIKLFAVAWIKMK